MKGRVKITTFVPKESADEVRKALGDSGAGTIGEYSYCSYSVVGTGRFKPSEKADPTVGQKGHINSVQEERIEVECDRDKASGVIDALKQAHPYEEVAFDIVPLIEEEEL